MIIPPLSKGTECWVCCDLPELDEISNVVLYANWVIETPKLEAEKCLVKKLNAALCADHAAEVTAEIFKREHCPACKDSTPTNQVDFEACAKLRAQFNPNSEAYNSWAPWAKMLCGSHKSEWEEAKLKQEGD